MLRSLLGNGRWLDRPRFALSEALSTAPSRHTEPLLPRGGRRISRGCPLLLVQRHRHEGA